MTEKQNRESGRKWDGRSRVSNDKYRKRYDEIFKKPVVEDKVKVKDLKKLLEEIADRNGF